MAGKIRRIALVTLLIGSLGGVFYLYHGNDLYAKDGIYAGKIGSIDKSKNEIIVNTETGELLNIGDRIYVRIDGRPVIMKVTFPMMTSSRCSVEKKYINQIGLIEKGMPLFKYVKGIENESVENSDTLIEPKKMSDIKIVWLPKGLKGLKWENTDRITSFSEGLAVVWGENGYGFIDKKGKLVIPAIYENKEEKYEDPFSEGVTQVYSKTDKFHFIDKKGNKIFSLEGYYSNGMFHNGLAWVSKKNGDEEKYGYINKEGKVVKDVKYNMALNFSENLAPIEDKDGKWGFINTSGNEIVQCQYDMVVDTGLVQDPFDFSDGLATVQKNKKWGFVDTTGKEVIPCQYDEVTFFTDGIASVKKGEKWGCIDKTGKVVLPIKNDCYYFHEGFAPIYKDTKYGYINKEGKIVIAVQYDDVKEFSEGLAAVKKGEKWGYIDTTGNEVIPCQYDGENNLNFSESLALVKNNNKYGFIDKKGNIVIPIELEYAGSFKEGATFIGYKGMHGFIFNPLNEK